MNRGELLDKIEELRTKLNKIGLAQANRKDLLKISTRLDELINIATGIYLKDCDSTDRK